MTDFVDDLKARTAARGWMCATTVWGLIERRAEATPDARLCHEDTGKELTFAQYREACLGVAAGLHREFGVGEGTAVSWELPTWNESLVLVGALCPPLGPPEPADPHLPRPGGELHHRPDRR